MAHYLSKYLSINFHNQWSYNACSKIGSIKLNIFLVIMFIPDVTMSPWTQMEPDTDSTLEITRLFGHPQPQMYPPVALNQYTLVNRTHKHIIYMLQGPTNILK